jgi:8-oxo-dGTP diphosphatase
MKDHLAEFNRQNEFPRPSVTVDLCVFTVDEDRLKVLLVRRGETPYRDRWALPGGFIKVGNAFSDQGESVNEAAWRELEEETGLSKVDVPLAEVGVFGAPYRDPRTRVITVAYAALVRPDLLPTVAAGTDAAAVQWWPVQDLLADNEKRYPDAARLAFDHQEILSAAHSWMQARVEGTTPSTDIRALVPPVFTAAELRRAHEAVLGRELWAGNFRRTINKWLSVGVLAKARKRPGGRGPPAQLYRFKSR